MGKDGGKKKMSQGMLVAFGDRPFFGVEIFRGGEFPLGMS